MSVADKAQRTTIIIMAVVFLVTSLGLSIFVIIDAVQSNKSGEQADNTSQTQAENPNAGRKLDNFTPVSEVSELQVTDPKAGDGAEITSADQTVTVEYTGAVAATGNVFDSSQGREPLTAPLKGLIAGWQEGMIGMKVGGQRRMLIPAEQGYGGTPPEGSGIPANAALVFDVTLKEVK